MPRHSSPEWNKKFYAIPGARVFAFGPPPLPGYGNVSGFTMQLQDRSGGSVDDLAGYVQQVQAAAAKRPEIGRVSTTFNPVHAAGEGGAGPREGPHARRAGGQRVPDPASLPERSLRERLREVRPGLQGLPAGRAANTPTSRTTSGNSIVRNNEGGMVPLSTLVNVTKMSGPNFATRFNLYLAAEMMGAPAPGYSSAQALKAMEEVMATMPSNVGYEWSGLTLQEKKSEGQAGVDFRHGDHLRVPAAGRAV